MRLFATIAYLFLISIYSCNKVTPCGFWNTFETKYLVENISDQGPWGGHRAMHWKANTGLLKSGEILDYADKNGWKIVDSIDVHAEDLSKWVWNSTPIFPLSHTGFTAMSYNTTNYEDFPRWIKTGCRLYFFKTGRVTIDPGTDEGTDTNGFVLLNNVGSEMSVYHLWGE